MGGDVLGALGCDGGDGIGDIRARGGAGQMAFGVGPHKSRHADGRDAEGQGHLAPHKGGGQIRREFAVQHRWHHADAVEGCSVARLGRLRPCPAVEVFPDEFRDASAGAVAQIR